MVRWGDQRAAIEGRTPLGAAGIEVARKTVVVMTDDSAADGLRPRYGRPRRRLRESGE